MSGAVELLGRFEAQATAELLSNFRVPCPRRMGGNWQRKMWFDGTYYWRGRYDPDADEIIFEYIAAAGLAGNTWVKNANASINAAGFAAGWIIADFTVRGSESGIKTTIHYSDGIDTWVAESNEASLTGWAWQNTSIVFDGTTPDSYKKVNLAANRKTPSPRLWISAVFIDASEGKQWVKTRKQTNIGDITAWDAAVDVSDVDNTNTIYGSSERSMGNMGPTVDDMMFVYKEGDALRSRYYTGVAWQAIQDIDTTTLPGKAAWDFEHGEEIGVEMGHVVYVDADGSVKWKERDAGAAQVWSAAETLHATSGHLGVGIAEHGAGWLWVVWVEGEDVLEYRLHKCVPEVWHPILANPALQFNVNTDAVVTTSTIRQPNTPDNIPSGEAVPICWIGETAPATPCAAAWGILIEYSIGSLKGVLDVRQLTSTDLNASLEVGQGSADLLAEFEAQATSDLLGKVDIRQLTTAGLLSRVEIRHMGTPVELLGEGIIRQPGSAELLGKTEIQQSGFAELLGKAVIRHSDSADLLGKSKIRHVGTPVELLGKAVIRLSGSTELLGRAVIRHSDTAELLGRFEAQATAELLGKFEVGQDSAELLGEFQIGQDSAELLGGFEVGQDSAELLGRFEAQATAELLGKGIIRNVGSAELLAKFEAQAIANLLGKVDITHSTELFAKFEAQATAELLAKFEAQAIANLLGKVDITHSTELFAKFEAQATAELLAKFEAQATAELPGRAVIRHVGIPVELLGKGIIRHSDTVEFLGKCIIRHSDSKDLDANVEICHWRRLSCVFIVRHTTSLDLPAIFWTRWPSRLWTSRRYINGVIALDEKLLGDASLEYVIEGVMEDTQGYLDNAGLPYSEWTDITQVPVQILRAVTYGTVAALYARHTQTFQSRVIPSITPVTVTVIGDAEKAMNYWEDRTNQMLEFYVTSQGGDIMMTSTDDEEPVFSMEDIPEEIDEYVSWRVWLQRRTN